LEFAQHQQSIILRQPLNGINGQWWSRTVMLTLGRQWSCSLQVIRRFCKAACDHVELLMS